jgi:hypothetical protein
MIVYLAIFGQSTNINESLRIIDILIFIRNRDEKRNAKVIIYGLKPQYFV